MRNLRMNSHVSMQFSTVLKSTTAYIALKKIQNLNSKLKFNSRAKNLHQRNQQITFFRIKFKFLMIKIACVDIENVQRKIRLNLTL